MKKILLVIILCLIFCQVNTDATNVKKIDLNMNDNEVNIIFLKLKDSNSLLVVDEEAGNLFIMDYKNDLGIKESLKVFDCIPNIYYLKDQNYQAFSNVHVSFQNNILKFRTNNYTLCVYDGYGKLNGCDFVYLKKLKEKIESLDQFSAIFYDEDIDEEKLRMVQESWVDNAIVSKNSFTILKLHENSYNILVVPSTNN